MTTGSLGAGPALSSMERIPAGVFSLTNPLATSGAQEDYLDMLTTRRLVQSVVVSMAALAAIAIPTVALLQDGSVPFPIQITIADPLP